MSISIQSIADLQHELRVESNKNIELLRKDVINELNRSTSRLARSKDLKALIASLDAFKEVITIKRRQCRIINSLRFPSMRQRHANIHDAHSRTFEWALKDEKTSRHHLASWLQSGSGTFSTRLGLLTGRCRRYCGRRERPQGPRAGRAAPGERAA